MKFSDDVDSASVCRELSDMHDAITFIFISRGKISESCADIK